MKVSTFKTLKFNAKQKYYGFKFRTRERLYKSINFFNNNKEFIFFATPIALLGIRFAGKQMVKAANIRKVENLKERYIYDRSLGHYWHLRRKLTANEYKKISIRKNNGEKLIDILEDLRVI